MKNEDDGNMENCSCSNLLKKHLKEHLIAQSRDIKKCNQNPVEHLRWSLFRNSQRLLAFNYFHRKLHLRCSTGCWKRLCAYLGSYQTSVVDHENSSWQRVVVEKNSAGNIFVGPHATKFHLIGDTDNMLFVDLFFFLI